MANMYYGAQPAPIEMPDDLLAHVKVVIATKLRRHESFMMSWTHPDGTGRSSIWIQPSIPLQFVFDSPEPPKLNRALLASLAASANANSGLIIPLGDTLTIESMEALAPSVEQAERATELAAV